MIYKLESSKDLDTVVKDFEDAAKAHKFGVLAKHNVKETLNSKGVEFAPECRIVEICNPHQAKKGFGGKHRHIYRTPLQGCYL